MSIVKTTKIVTPTCTVPQRQPTSDSKIRFRPKLNVPHGQQMLDIIRQAAPQIADAPVGKPRLAVSKSDNASGSFRTWRLNGRNVEIQKDAFLQERDERMANARIVKRAPDEPVVIVNATDTAAYIT